MIRINLLPVRVSKKKEAGKNQLVFFALAIVFALICNFWWSRSRGDEMTAREEKVKRTKAEIAQLEKIIGEVTNIKAQQQAVKDKLAVLEKLKAGRQGPVRMLDELAAITPKRLWLRKLDEKGGAITFDGSAGTIDDVSAFLAALKKSPFFSAVELKKTAAKRDGKFKLVDFTINAAVNYTPAVQLAAAAPEKR
ncbi:PilN domain-containing protein [Anaeromyxobacter diazotrophicus]|uniref:Fimbrial protein n=1 Tax=Anaeromyxobacter diazotrophicus TaxID=2590199 RepID=A0A7I9VHY3_9BACT|nr:PilN domain-containing protein [Anaeromyxobacter diazotrophicus]GEJ55637.1 fimbrial protein [Anaeromyxobacter diazotrophicus]